MAEHQAERRILVGVTYGQSDAVLRHAARFARTFDAALVCAHVDPGRYVVEELPDGLTLPFTSAHMRRNALAALAAARTLGVEPDGLLDVALSSFRGRFG